MSYPFITSVGVRLKTLDATFDNLSPVVMWVGDNGSGKTTVLNGAQLSLMGFALDVAGRDSVSAGYAIEELFAGESGEAFVDLSDGTRAGFPQGNSNLPARLPYQEAADALIGSIVDDRAYAWLLDVFLTDADVAATPAPEMKERVLTQFAGVVRGSGIPPENRKARLINVLTTTKKLIKSHKDAAGPAATALGVLKNLGATPSAQVFDAIETLTKFQFEKGLDTCGVCASEGIARDTFVVRNQTATAKRGMSVAVPASLIATLNREVEEHTAEIDALQLVADAAKAWVIAVVKLKLDAIIAMINAYLPPPYVLSFVTEPRFRFALSKDRGVTFATALSGAETVIAISAVAAVASRALREQGFTGVLLCIPPDRAYGEGSVRVLLDIADAAKTHTSTWIQVINRPRGRPRHGVTFVELGEVSDA